MGDESNGQDRDRPHDETSSQAEPRRTQQRSPVPYDRLHFNDFEMNDLYARDLVEPWDSDEDPD